MKPLRWILTAALLAVGIVPAQASPWKTCSDGSRIRTSQTCPAIAPAPALEPAPAPAPEPAPAPAPAPSGVPAGYTVKQAVGLRCDGVTDDTVALQAALQSTRPYDALQLPVGTCVTNNVLKLNNRVNVMVFGGGKDLTILKANTPTLSSFVVYNGSYVTLSGFQVTSPSAVTRDNSANGRGIDVETADHLTIDDVKINHVGGAGILLNHATNSTVTNSEVLNNLADGFHVTGRSANVTMQFNRATGSGDDCFASIGYGTGINTNISFLDNFCSGNKASGVSFEGTNGGKAYRNHLEKTGVACIRVASVSSFNTGPVDDVDFQDNDFVSCKTRADVTHPNILLYVSTPGGHVHGISFQRTSISAPLTKNGVRAFGKSGTEDVTASFAETTFTGDFGTLFKIEAYAAVAQTGTTLNGNPVP